MLTKNPSRRTVKRDHVQVSPLESAVLLFNLASRTEKDESADYTFNEILREMNGYMYTHKREIVETALYCCNLADEEGTFWHPLNIPFRSFAYKLAENNGTKFDLTYNLLRGKADGEKES